MREQANLESFIGSSFRSVWALEVLRYLLHNRGTCFTADELIAALRVSDAVIVRSVENLSAAGLAMIDGDGCIGLHEAGEEHAALLQAAIDFYEKSPDKVRRLIVARASPAATAFANAFRLRKD